MDDRPFPKIPMPGNGKIYVLKSWERVEDDVLYGPGYAVDLRTEDILFFDAPGIFTRTSWEIERLPETGSK